MNNQSTDQALLADRFAEIRSEIARLESEAESIRAEIIATGESQFLGFAHMVTVSRYERDSTNWKAIASKFKPSRQLIAAHTKTAQITSLTCSERK